MKHWSKQLDLEMSWSEALSGDVVGLGTPIALRKFVLRQIHGAGWEEAPKPKPLVVRVVRE